MDPVTHAVIGAAMAKITGNTMSITDPATVAIVIGAVFPDSDILMQKWGDYAYLKNHRGASHSIFGLAASALLISAVLCGIYHEANIFSLFLWAFLGCFSHTFFDVFNSYGAKLLWPFTNRKFSLSLMLVFDPIFLGTLVGYVASQDNKQYIFLAAFAIHMVSRALMRLYVVIQLRNRFKDICDRISILPSMSGLFRWSFILENDACNIVGERNILRRSVKIIRKLYKLEEENLEKVLVSPVGQFFKEFTPLFHIAAEKADGVTRYIFIDMRYYLRNNFLHHAILELDENDSIIKASFNPYSIKRSCDIKDSKLQHVGQPINA